MLALVSVTAGIYYAPAVWWKVPPRGVEISFAATAYDYRSRPMMSSWTNTSGNVWEYTGSVLVGRNVWAADGREFCPVGDPANLVGTPWRVHTTSGGVTSISLPGGVTPASVGPLLGTCTTDAPKSDGMVWRNPKSRFCRAVNYQSVDGNVLFQVNNWYTDGLTNCLTILTGVDVVHWNRHITSFPASNLAIVTVTFDRIEQCCPPGDFFSDSSWIGVNNGAFTDLVDQPLDASLSALNPGTFVSRYDFPVSMDLNASMALPGSNAGQAFVEGYHNTYLCHGQGGATVHIVRWTGILRPPVGSVPDGATTAVGVYTGVETHVEFEVLAA